MKQPEALPPYQRIAGELRRRIAAGELRPGDRVPSTRALARKWRVAMATAAHALKTLEHEGVVCGVPRSGTVVAGTRERVQRPRERETALTSSQIVAAAIAIADAEGLPALSLRGVAGKLGVPVMSLYRYVGNKDSLLRLMADAAIGEEKLPASVPKGWRAQLEVAGRVQWRGLRKHPWLARLMSITRPYPLPNALAHANWVLRALDGHGVGAGARLRLHVILHGFIQGIAVNLETEAQAISDTGMTDDDWMRTQASAFAALAASGHYPAFAAMFAELASGFELDFEVLFELGLGALLDGFESIIEPAAQRGGR
jgi:DNA-binding transcriptional regulator YhcF (GntR family)